MPDYTLTVDFSMLGCSQLPPTGCKYSGIPESSPHRCPTHILSHNHYHRMGICEETEGQKSQKSTFIPTQSTFRCFYDLNFGPTVSNMEIFRTHVHTGTSHTFCLITTTIACVCVKKHEVKSRRKARWYPHSRLLAAFMISTSPPHFQTWRYFGHMSTQVHHTHSVS
jgi:hypothetical protein